MPTCLYFVFSCYRSSGRRPLWMPSGMSCVGLICTTYQPVSIISFLNHSVLTCESFSSSCVSLFNFTFSNVQTLRADRRAVNMNLYINNTPNRIVSSSLILKRSTLFFGQIITKWWLSRVVASKLTEWPYTVVFRLTKMSILEAVSTIIV